MARDFDGTNDQISFGSDATIDNFVALTVAFWLKWDATGVGDVIIGKASNTADGWRVTTDSATNTAFITRDFSGAIGGWRGSTVITGTHHYVISHSGDAADDPRIVIDGSADTVTETNIPSGTLDADAANNLIAGEASGGTNDLDGALQNLVVYNGLMTAAEENLCRWWGCAPSAGPGVAIYHPFFTESLVNKGSATANGTATGTTVVNLPVPTVRPGTAMLGFGVGW